MNLFEYQGKKLFQDYGINIPKSLLVSSVADVINVPDGGVVKPQILMGGRGKAGAIKLVNTESDTKKWVEYFLKTPIKGHQANKIHIEEKINIDHEYYFSIFVNRSFRCITLMFSDKGGIDIESNNQSISAVNVNPIIGIRNYMLKDLLFSLDVQHFRKIEKTIRRLYDLFMDKKMIMLEINPLVIAKNNEVVALDSKVILDDWYIDSNIEINTESSEVLTEVEKSFARVNANAVQMNGDIVVYAAGAGVSMAIADSITRLGGKIGLIIDRGNMKSDSPDPEINKIVAEAEKSVAKLNPKAIVAVVFYQAGRVDYECKTLKLAFEEISKDIPVLVSCKGRLSEEGIKHFDRTNIQYVSSISELCKKAVDISEVQ